MFLTNHAVDSVFLEGIVEGHHALFGTAAVLVVFANGVVRNEIDIRQLLNVLEQLSQFLGLLYPVIDFIEHDVLKGHTTVGRLNIVFNSRKKLFNREGPVNPHDAGPQIIIRGMEGYS